MEKKLLNAICDKCGSDEMYINKKVTETKAFKIQKVEVYCKYCGYLHKIENRHYNINARGVIL